MLPSELKSEYFSSYPPEAKRLAQEYIGTLRGLPLSFASGLLRELIDYDYKFPAERKALESELANLARLSESERSEWLQGFIRIALSSKLAPGNMRRATPTGTSMEEQRPSMIPR